MNVRAWLNCRSVRNERGQVAIFVALIFQVLFLFFAMVINVGLLVHHKINLQNAVDLAAYYGASKQAENLNVIAHTNYQIRQSWKLLVFRYRELGTAGEYASNGNDHPFNKSSGELIQPVENQVGANPYFFENPPFCITYHPFKPMPPNENTCRAASDKAQSTVAIFQKPAIIAGFLGFTGAISAATQAMQNQVVTRCKVMGSYNYITLSKFVASYIIDQSSRMDAIKAISDSMSVKKDTFTDVDGGDVRNGMIATLRKNLTAPNESALKDDDVQTINSLGLGNCAQQTDGGFRNWIKPIKIMPGFSYIDTDCDNTQIGSVAKELSPADPPKHMVNSGETAQYFQMAQTLNNFIGFNQSNIFNKFNPSLGVEKNPWCMAYVGIKASTTPKIPFSPLGSIVLTARALAKPFGGRIGPWYGKDWPSASPISNSPIGNNEVKLDKLIPPRISDTSIFSNEAGFRDPFRIANHSRFVGDQLGHKSRQVLGYFGRAIFRLDPKWRVDEPVASPDDVGFTDGSSPNFQHWDHLPGFIQEGAGDILAWNRQKNEPSDMRFLELISILPDQFDVTYYSIEPDFYTSYYTRLQTGLAAKLGIQKDVRPDIGHRAGTQFEKYSIRNQYDELKKDNIFKMLRFNWKENFLWTTDSVNSVLTGWAPKGLTDFAIDSERFGKCNYEIPEGEPASPGSCVRRGGTTGYAVKLTARDYLKRNDLKLGGPTTQGAILNQPPDDF